MIDWTDRYCRYFHRQLSRHARLYTEMVVDEAILHGDPERLLGFDPAEQPVTLQLGGSDPERLAAAAKVGAGFGYDEINLNVGCPSDRVQSGRFGACLMREPALVADCVAAMAAAVHVPVTVKSRIGVDDQDPHQVLPDFIDQVARSGCTQFIVHARKAWLAGLSPKENRTVPPLDYELVQQIKADRPGLEIILNGGIADIDQAHTHLATFDGVMLGRAAYERPFLLAQVDGQIFGDPPKVPVTRAGVAAQVAAHFAGRGVGTWRYARHMLGLFHGRPGARQWRRILSEEGRAPYADAAWFTQLAQTIAALDDAAPNEAVPDEEGAT